MGRVRFDHTPRLTPNIPNPGAENSDQIPYLASHTELGMVKDLTLYHVKYVLHGISYKVNHLTLQGKFLHQIPG